MQFIEQWLSGLGLDYIIPKLKEQGITTPKKLSALSLKDMYEILGIENAEDRKKLYYLIQRLITIINKEKPAKVFGDTTDTSVFTDDTSSYELSSLSIKECSESSSVVPSYDQNDETCVPSKVRSMNRINTLIPTPMKKERGESPSSPRHANQSNPESPDAAVDSEIDSPDKMKSQTSSRITYRSPAMITPLESKYETSKSGKEESKVDPDSPQSVVSESKSESPLSTSRLTHRPQQPVSAASISKSEVISASPTKESPSTLRSPFGSSNMSYSRTFTKSHSSRTLNVSPTTPASTKSSPASPTGNRPHSSSILAKQADKLTTFRERAANIKNRYHAECTTPNVETSLSADSSDKTDNSQREVSFREKATLIKDTRIVSSSDRGGKSSGRYSPPPIITPPPIIRSTATTEVSASRSHINRRASLSPPVPVAACVADYQEDDNSMFEPENETFPGVDTSYDDDYLVEDMAIRVIVRKRPISKIELSRGDKDCLEILNKGKLVVHEPKVKLDLTKYVEPHLFKFDDVFQENETNQEIYRRSVKYLIKTVFEGGKASCFAYGQTGSGKTFTMMGSNPSNPAAAAENSGLYVLVARDIFKLLEQPDNYGLKMFVSCFEIYGGKLYDLLNERNPIKCLEDAKGVVQTPGIKEVVVDDVEALLHLMSTAHSQRSVGTTGANEESSRSHQILQLRVKDAMAGKTPKKKAAEQTIGQFSFIDLAGSERGSDTNHNSKQTRMEGAEINTSLLALKEVIRSLEKKSAFTSFRGSKLTQVLKDSFVGSNTKTCMVACVSPAYSNCEHTLNTLRYADRVKEHIAGEPESTTIETNSRLVLHSVPEKHGHSSTVELPTSQTITRTPTSAVHFGKNKNESPHPQISNDTRIIRREDVKREVRSRSTTPAKRAMLSKHLIASHKSSLKEAIEMMNTELELVRSMEAHHGEEGDIEEYMDTLEALLDCQDDSATSLRHEIQIFHRHVHSVSEND